MYESVSLDDDTTYFAKFKGVTPKVVVQVLFTLPSSPVYQRCCPASFVPVPQRCVSDCCGPVSPMFMPPRRPQIHVGWRRSGVALRVWLKKRLGTINLTTTCTPTDYNTVNTRPLDTIYRNLIGTIGSFLPKDRQIVLFFRFVSYGSNSDEENHFSPHMMKEESSPSSSGTGGLFEVGGLKESYRGQRSNRVHRLEDKCHQHDNKLTEEYRVKKYNTREHPTGMDSTPAKVS
ncbi:hypothetical protein PIB30_051534 [Stylosanthes scabra]|uniref:Uncharacterized protein n=1 Tax=Stylosanthes scabra TaxID=79078 RepID=A0ABU6VGU0_9FABA|nr:hypothetical protein [Stylosanthes scabra]